MSMTACGRCGGTACCPTAASPHPADTSWASSAGASCSLAPTRCGSTSPWPTRRRRSRSEEHTSELQSPCNLVCRLLLEKKNSFEAAQKVLDYYESYFQIPYQLPKLHQVAV